MTTQQNNNCHIQLRSRRYFANKTILRVNYPPPPFPPLCDSALSSVVRIETRVNFRETLSTTKMSQKVSAAQVSANISRQQAPRRSDVSSLLQTLHWLPVEQRFNYKLAVLTFKTQQTSSPQYLSKHISLRTSARSDATLDRRPSHCCACHFDGNHLPDDRSALPHLCLKTHCQLLC